MAHAFYMPNNYGKNTYTHSKCKTSFIRIWIFSIITEYTNTYFQKQTAFVFRWVIILSTSNIVNEPNTYKVIREEKTTQNSTYKKSKYTSVIFRMLQQCLRIITYRHTHKICITYIFPRQTVTQTRLNVMSYVHCLPSINLLKPSGDFTYHQV
jgi:hypothetical protein